MSAPAPLLITTEAGWRVLRSIADSLAVDDPQSLPLEGVVYARWRPRGRFAGGELDGDVNGRTLVQLARAGFIVGRDRWGAVDLPSGEHGLELRLTPEGLEAIQKDAAR